MMPGDEATKQQRAQGAAIRDQGAGRGAQGAAATFLPSHLPTFPRSDSPARLFSISDGPAGFDGWGDPDAAGEALLDVLAALYDALKQLAEMAGRKLEALRLADAEALHAIAHGEHHLLQTIATLEPRRSAALAQLAQALRLECEAEPTLSQLVKAAPQPLASRLAARAAGLRDVARVLRDRNAKAAFVARDLYTHVRGVLHEVARGCTQTVGYGPDGPKQQQSRNWIDAVG